MELKPGYKQTEVGAIPEEWEVKSVRDLAQVKTGPFGTLLKAQEYSGSKGVPLISVGEIGSGTFNITEHTPLVPDAVIRRLPQYVLRSGDIVFGRKGAVERSALVTESEDGWFLGSDGISIRPQRMCHPPYLAWQFQRYEVQAWLLQNAIGTTMASLNQGILNRVQIPYAPLPEQRAIARALSDVDVLLGSLDQLIAKKRDLKQATMQQLLTGHQRLPGFEAKCGYKQTEVGVIPEDWKTATLRALSSMKSGEGITNTNIDQFSKYPCYGGNGLRGFTTRFTHDGRYALVGRQGALCGNVVGVEGKFFASEHAIVVTASPRTDIRWLTLVLGEMHLNQYSESSAQPGLSVSKILSLNIACPSSKAEQAAIAEVLSDMDAEIATLEQRRDKTRDLKQGMMQELLTGRTRLV